MAASQEFLAGPAVFGGGRVIASPFQFALTEDDNLQIVSANSLVGVVLAIQGRRIDENGQLQVFAYTHTPNSDRSSKSENFKIGRGALLNLTIFAVTGAPLIGQTFVSARLIRGLSAATVLLGGLLGGYITASQPLAYPGSPIESSIAGGGYVRSITGTDPAPGQPVVETVPTGARWELMAVQAGFTASAVVATRDVRIRFTQGGLTLLEVPNPGTVMASQGVAFQFGQGLPFETVIQPFIFVGGLPSAGLLLAGDAWSLQTRSMDVADDWGPPSYKVREWLEVNA